ncbi:hypothetical protein DRO41_00255 [Candidatus Bathyarchaeota archaeon]|nr:MAG: hypothetical protein DRO41_00255 [Candidatus Bathyarchaeota archaeon]
MALTIRNKKYTVFGNKRVLFFDVDFGFFYHPGGEELKPSTLGLQHFDFVDAPSKGGYIFEFDYTNNKIKVLYPQGGEKVGTHDGGASVDSGDVQVTSTAANGDIITVRAGKAREVAAGCNLSNLTGVRVMVIGS